MSRANWDDLAVRMGVGLALAAVGLFTVIAGGNWFHAFVTIAAGLMVWELVRMASPGQDTMAISLGLLSAFALTLGFFLPLGMMLPLLFAPALVGFGQLRAGRYQFAIYSVAILIAAFGLAHVRDDFGVTWMLWLALVVIVTDVAGYFAGRFLGGPKFWPRISPKKTWSGTVAGWIGAAIVAGIFMAQTGAGASLIGISVAVAMASQLGDVAESALKRKAGVKDSSQLLPGHGGLLDRFDGMLGAALFLLLIEQAVSFPPVAL